MAPRSAFQPNGSAVPSVAMTPVAPHASAVRTMAPTLPASWTPVSIGTSGRLTVERLRERRRTGSARWRRCRTVGDRAHRGEHLVGDGSTRAPVRCASSASVSASADGAAIGNRDDARWARLTAALPAARCAPSSSAAPLESVAARELAEAAHQRILAARDAFHPGGDCTCSLLPSLTRRRRRQLTLDNDESADLKKFEDEIQRSTAS